MTTIGLVLVGLTSLLQQGHGAAIHEEVFNGKNAVPGQFPYQARLINYEPDGQSSICGGSLIALNWVLSAAHCTEGVQSTNVSLGVTNIHDIYGVVSYLVPNTQIFNHPNYNSKTYDDDISLLKLPENVTPTYKIRVIALPKLAWADPSTFNDYQVTVSGWGRMYNVQNSSTQDLQYARVYKMNQDACFYWFYYNNNVTDHMFCTTKWYAGTCSGDSGGPQVIFIRNIPYLIGATSWSVGDCQSVNPVVSVNVASFLPWINNVTGISIS